MDLTVESETEGGLVIDEREDGELEDDDKEEKEKERGAGSTMTLRPIGGGGGQTESKPSSSLPSTSSASIPTTSSSFSLPSSSSFLPSMAPSGKGRMQWNIDEMMHFYDGVKQFGKDFDAVHKYMERRKMERDKEQLRNFYFNFFKLVKAAADIKDEDWSAEIPRDARDLFVVINGCEWKKKTDNYKYEQAKLKSLIMEGQTVTRFRCKKQHVTIKTPCCPALLQFFSFNRRISRFPPDIILYLGPKTPSDGTNVLSRGQNKNLCIRLNTSDRVERIFDLIELKWKGGTEDQRPFKLRIFPSKHTLMGEILFTPSPSSFANVSINMLREDRIKTESVKMQIKKGHAEETDCYQAAQSLIEYLSIDRDILKRGLTKESAGDASVAELFAVCGLHRDLTLVYSIEEGEERGEEDDPWNVLVHLLGRGYGEATAERRGASVGKTPSRDDQSTTEGETSIVAPVKRRCRAIKRPVPPPPPSDPGPIPESPIVAAEFDEFTEQLRAFAASPPKAKRRSPVRNTQFFYRPPFKSESASHCPTPVSLFTTGRSPVHSRSSGHPQVKRRRPAHSSGSGHAPSGSSPSTSFSHMMAEGDDTLGQALKAAFASPGNSLLDAPSTSTGMRGERSGRGGTLDVSPLKASTTTMSSLPFDVRLSMEQMMNQSSVDFSFNFNQLINHPSLSDSPSKLSKPGGSDNNQSQK
ncbi:hypothetical protein PFISCL1PPCAC_10231 [Pristionchus fissidentatus]|uniref:SANT domain-containing protein n=1 Tax=Pristionchus fissidentatus TaxID=1538716 RepID=A0AAV5VHG3_9BILA|nr:hypothetical protein PFISCL1PPCAC_10231 [Pristionchus fissidentatus]